MKATHEYILEYNQLYKEMDAIYHDAAVRIGLSDCAFWILYMLRNHDGLCKQSELSENASMPPQTVNSSLKKLEKDGLVELRKIPGKMGKSIHLTDKGEQFVIDRITPLNRAEERACESFSEDEIETFMRIFRTLVTRLDQEIGNTLKGGS